MENTVEMIPDMRGIIETAKRFNLPVHFVRQAVRTGKVKSVQAGSKKYYVNQQSMIDYLEDDVVLPQYSYAVEPEDKVTYNNRSEFAKQIHGKEMGKVLGVIDELMSTLKILHPKLYDGVMMKIAE